MSRSYFLDLAAQGLAMPLAVDLFVHKLSSPEKIHHDSHEMARVIVGTAESLKTPLAVAPMDLRVEKEYLARLIGIPEDEKETFHLGEPLDADTFKRLDGAITRQSLTQRMNILCEALSSTSTHSGLLPVGMIIGPFSLLTKVIEDAITSVYMVGMGLEPDDDPSVELALQLLKLNTKLIKEYAVAQVEAGAKAIIMCEPAANTVYISPKMMDEGSDVFEQCILAPCREIAEAIRSAGGELIFHDCGTLTSRMISDFNTLDPVMISFGGDIDLPTAAGLVRDDIVIFGNIPSKLFPSETDMPGEKVAELCEELIERVGATGQPYILASECDILSVPGKEEQITRKADIIAGYNRMATSGAIG